MILRRSTLHSGQHVGSLPEAQGRRPGSAGQQQRGARQRGACADPCFNSSMCCTARVLCLESHTHSRGACWRPCEAGSLSPISLVRFRQGRVLSRFEGGHFWGSREEKAKRTRHDDSSGYGRRYRFTISYRARSVYGVMLPPPIKAPESGIS